MALERKDIRAKLDDDMHAALKAICDVENIDMGEFIEQALLPVIQKRVHEAILLADRLKASGIFGKNREHPGTTGSRQK